MRTLLLAVGLFLGFTAAAQEFPTATEIRYIQGRAQHSGFCMGNDWFCVDNVKRSTEQLAVEDASRQCRYEGGYAPSYGNSCYTHCNPNNIPTEQTWISCWSDCTVRCEIKDSNNTEVQ